MRNIREIIIHCADTPNGKEFHATDIDRWHKERGWSGIGYHFVICIDGTVEEGRPVEMIGSHAEGHNTNSIGICMMGKDKFAPAQWESLKNLVISLRGIYKPTSILGHYEVATNGKTCPNFDVSSWAVDYVPDDKKIQ